MPQVEKNTPHWANAADFHRECFSAAHAVFVTTSPFPQLAAAILVGQISHETGAWKGVYDGVANFNLAGIKAGRGYEGEYFTSLTTEYEDGESKRRRARFRSYGTLKSGVIAIVQLLEAMPRYGDALDALLAGLPSYYAELHQAPARQGKPGWYTAPLTDYVMAACLRLHTVCVQCRVQPPVQARLADPQARDALVALYGGGLKKAQRELGVKVDNDFGPETFNAMARDLLARKSAGLLPAGTL